MTLKKNQRDMQKHTKIYMTFFGYEISDEVFCEMCSSPCQDIHHISARGMGGSKVKDYIENIIGLCRECHLKAEHDNMFNMFCRIKHLENVCHQVYGLIEHEKKYRKKTKK
jgi:hypothetical protein